MDIPVKVSKGVQKTKENGKKKPAWHKNIKILIPAIIMKQQNLKQ